MTIFPVRNVDILVQIKRLFSPGKQKPSTFSTLSTGGGKPVFKRNADEFTLFFFHIVCYNGFVQKE